MDKMILTGPQQAVYEFVAKHGAVEMVQLKSRGLDVRAANNLVKNGVLTLTNNVYRIKARKKVAQEEAPQSAVTEVAPLSQPSEVTPAAQEPEIAPAVEAANDTEKAPEEPAEGSEAQAGEGTPETAAESHETASEGHTEGSEAEGGKKAKKAKAAKAPKAKRAKETMTTATGICLCGCGAELGPKRRFALGHDAKLHSIVLKVARGQAGRGALPEACFDKSSATVEYLRGAPWMTDEIREAIGI
ncbi:hypothetical protein WMF31_00830 [Sorangium sp. So ce1036]|uniref:hypothetical protein n=1 Tax=Sorangium sp. So ce1036 TaxID=3133328 RepID=UPI003F0B5B68